VLYKKSKEFQVSGTTRVYALIGDPVAHSISPSFWNAALRHSEIDAIYIAMQVGKACAPAAFKGIEALSIAGINVTRPLKRMAAEYCHILNEPARSTGAVNTIRFSEHGGEGWNTDATGLLRILTRLDLRGRPALIMGNGASAATAVWAIKKCTDAQIFILGRSFAEQPAVNGLETWPADPQINCLAWNDKNFSYAAGESAIIVNTTPLGWSTEDFVPELDKCLEKNKVFVDFNYAPDSKLVACARKSGCVVIDGRELLLEQGLESFEILTGCEAPAEIIRNCIYS